MDGSLGTLIFLAVVAAVIWMVVRARKPPADDATVRAEAELLARRLIADGKAVVAIANFSLHSREWSDLGDGAWVDKWTQYLLLLTESELHKVKYKLSWTRRPKGLASNYSSSRLEDILETQVTQVHEDAALPWMNLTVLYENGGQEQWGRVHDPDAETFVSQFERVLATSRSLAAAQNASTDIASQLTHLAELREQGALSEEEWTRAKDLFLGKPPNKKQEAIQLLNSLYGLHRSGVLSEGEFNIKKWEILSQQ